MGCGIEPRNHRVAWVGGVQALSPTRVAGYAVRTYSGRPKSNMRFRTLVAMATSVACRPSVCERSPPPITHFQRDIGLHQSTPVVSRRPLPAHAAALGDISQMPVLFSGIVAL